MGRRSGMHPCKDGIIWFPNHYLSLSVYRCESTGNKNQQRVLMMSLGKLWECRSIAFEEINEFIMRICNASSLVKSRNVRYCKAQKIIYRRIHESHKKILLAKSN
jgi:hypothetical protein